MKSLFIAAMGCFLFLFGIIGLIVPILPGFIFLILALVCFGTLYPPLRKNLSRNPRLNRYFNRLDTGARFDLLTRCKLTFWATLEAIGSRPKQR